MEPRLNYIHCSLGMLSIDHVTPEHYEEVIFLHQGSLHRGYTRWHCPSSCWEEDKYHNEDLCNLRSIAWEDKCCNRIIVNNPSLCFEHVKYWSFKPEVILLEEGDEMNKEEKREDKYGYY